MFEIAIRAEAKKKTEIIFLRNKYRTGHEAMEEFDISGLLTILVIFFRAAIVPYVTYGFAYSVLLVFFRIDLAESNSLAAFGSATTGLQMACDYCGFLDKSFKEISNKYSDMYGFYDVMESFSPNDLVAIKDRILQVFGLGESFDIKISSASVRSSASQIEITLIFWLEPILWLLAAPFHIVVSPLALIGACFPWSCPVNHVEYRNTVMSRPAARFLDRWLFADGILKFALLGPIAAAALLPMALLWALLAWLRAPCVVQSRVGASLQSQSEGPSRPP